MHYKVDLTLGWIFGTKPLKCYPYTYLALCNAAAKVGRQFSKKEAGHHQQKKLGAVLKKTFNRIILGSAAIISPQAMAFSAQEL